MTAPLELPAGDNPTRPRRGWRRPAAVTAILATAAVTVAAWPKPWPVVTLPSGHHISHIVIGHFIVPNEVPVLRFRYETQLPLADTAALRAEAREWPEYRGYVMRPSGWLVAALSAPDSSPGRRTRLAVFAEWRSAGPDSLDVRVPAWPVGIRRRLPTTDSTGFLGG